MGLCKNVHSGKVTGPMNLVQTPLKQLRENELFQVLWCYHALSLMKVSNIIMKLMGGVSYHIIFLLANKNSEM